MSRIVTFGEIMLRLNPQGHARFVQAGVFEASYAGGEANVAVSLANYGHHAAFVSKVPSHEVGQAAINELRRYGVDTEKIVRGGPRLGVYFAEKGASQRPSKVIYDRTGSSIAMARRSEFHWEALLEGVDWFHFTGITPALGGELAQICMDACQVAKKMGLTVSCDLNYRKKLWSREDARAAMSQLMPFVDVCISNEEDAWDVFGIAAAGTDLNAGRLERDSYISVAQQLAAQFGFKVVAITLRGSLSASDNDWAGMLFRDGTCSFSTGYRVHIVDRVGGGDSFGGGLIHGLLSGWSDQRVIDFAVAASCLKHTVEHDFNLVCEEEVESLVNGNTSGRVQR